MKTSIFDTLQTLQLTSKKTRSIFHKGTRDQENLIVWKDDISGVIYIDDFYIGDLTYEKGAYRNEEINLGSGGLPTYERKCDAQRRLDEHLQYVVGKTVLDYGCGAGDFLKLIQNDCNKVCGIEIQQNYVNALNDFGIDCLTDLESLSDNEIETCVSFHVIEHLLQPIEVLSRIKEKMVINGTIVVEVPHANDFLFSIAGLDSFKSFGLWSQHLVLHTRESLKKMLLAAGFSDIIIYGVQRYALSNHFNWLINEKPGGHKTSLSILDTSALKEQYSLALSNIDATDTLVAVAKVA